MGSPKALSAYNPFDPFRTASGSDAVGEDVKRTVDFNHSLSRGDAPHQVPWSRRSESPPVRRRSVGAEGGQASMIIRKDPPTSTRRSWVNLSVYCSHSWPISLISRSILAWRRGRDSNPRDDSSPSTRSPGMRLRPLGHPSSPPGTLAKPAPRRNKPRAGQSIPSELLPFGGGNARSSAKRSSSLNTTSSAPRFSRTCSGRAAFGITIIPS